MTTPFRPQCNSRPERRASCRASDARPTPSATARAIREFRRLARLLRSAERPDRDAAWIAWQIRALYREIPDLVLTLEDVREAFGLDDGAGNLVLGTLTDVGFLRADGRGFVAAPPGEATTTAKKPPRQRQKDRRPGGSRGDVPL